MRALSASDRRLLKTERSMAVGSEVWGGATGAASAPLILLLILMMMSDTDYKGLYVIC